MLVFIETETQLRYVAKEYPATQVVVMTPCADYMAQNLGIDVISIEDLCNEADLLPISEEIINTVEDMCDYADKMSQTIIKSRYANRILSLRAYFHFIKQNFDSYVIRIEQIALAIEQLSPKTVLIFEPTPFRQVGLSVQDKPVLGLTTQLVPLVAKSKGIPIVEIGLQSTKVERATTNSLPVVPSNSVSWAHRIKNIPIFLDKYLKQFRLEKPLTDAPLLLHSLYSDLGSGIVDQWTASGGYAFGLSEWLNKFGSPNPTDQMCAQGERLWKRLSNDLSVRSLVSYKGIKLWPFFEGILEQIFRVHYPKLLAEIKLGKKAFRSGSMALLSGGIVGSNYIFGRICHRYRIPFFSYHFSGFTGFSILPTHERYDLAECDFFICGGSGAMEGLRAPPPQARWRTGVKRAVPIPTGLPWLQDEMKNYRQPRVFGNKQVRRIMVILSALVGDCRYLGYTFIPEIENSRSMFRVVKRLLEEEIEIVIKQPLKNRYPQQTHPVVLWLESNEFSNVVFADDVDLMECLNLADAFVMESPSTPLLKLATTRVPILLNVDRRYYLLVSRARELLQRRCAVFAEDMESFMLGLEEFLTIHVKNGLPVSGDVDDTFLHEFGIGSDNNSSENVVSFVREKIDNH